MPYRPVHWFSRLRPVLAAGAVTASACVDAPTTAPRLVASQGATAAKQSTTDSKILVMQNSPNNLGIYQVFTVNDDGTQVLQVTNLASGIHPSWAPDGKRILFIGSLNTSSPLDVASINSDGTGVTFLHQESLCPNWPVALGKDIMFQGGCDGTLYRVRADGTGSTPIAGSVCGFSQPSPDAQARTVAVCRDYDIVLVDVASGAVTNLTNTPNSYEDSPAFSPNGKLIAFVRLGIPNEVWVMNADGTNATLVAMDAVYPHWSPDGKRLAFSRQDAVYLTFDVFTMNADGTGVTNLTKTTGIHEFVTAWASY